MKNSKILLRKIISGGQTGADTGGLLAAKVMGYKLGGTAPRFYKNEMPADLNISRYFIKNGVGSYKDRTKINVVESDGTLLCGLMTGGTFQTKSFCLQFERPFFELDGDDIVYIKKLMKNNGIIDDDNGYFKTLKELKKEFITWLIDNKIKVLNVAGKRESNNPGITLAVMHFLVYCLEDEREPRAGW